MPTVKVSYLGSEHFEQVLIQEDMPFNDFLIHYLLAARRKEMQTNGNSTIDSFYRIADLDSVLREDGNFEQRYQERRRRILENPLETISLWGGGYSTDAITMAESERGTELKVEKRDPEMLSGDRIGGMFDLNYDAFKSMIAEAAKPTLKEFILDVFGYNTGKGYYISIGRSMEIGYVKDALCMDNKILQLTKGEDIYLLPNFETSDNPFVNDIVIRDVSSEAQKAAAEKFRQFLEECEKTSAYGKLTLL